MLKLKRIKEDAKWDAVWDRLRREGRVDVAPEFTPYCPSSCAALAQVAENPGERLNVRVVTQNRRGEYGAGGVE